MIPYFIPNYIQLIKNTDHKVGLVRKMLENNLISLRDL